MFTTSKGINCFHQDLQVDLDLGELDLTSQDEFILDEVDGKEAKYSIYTSNYKNYISLYQKFGLKIIYTGKKF